MWFVLWDTTATGCGVLAYLAGGHYTLRLLDYTKRHNSTGDGMALPSPLSIVRLDVAFNEPSRLYNTSIIKIVNILQMISWLPRVTASQVNHLWTRQKVLKPA